MAVPRAGGRAYNRRGGRMDDCVVGCISGCRWDEIEVWANSLVASGFSGRKVALIRDCTPVARRELLARGFEVGDFSALPAAISAEADRFAMLRQYLFDQRANGRLYRWVLATGARDLMFQRDPLDFLRRLDPPRLVLSQEGLRYENAEWNAGNLARVFGLAALETLRAAAPCNVGVLAGPHYSMEGLALLLEHHARAATAEVAAQAALNVITLALAGSLHMHRAGSAEPWACHAGIMADPQRIGRVRPYLLGPEPTWRDGRVLTQSGEPYAIVHQYDWVPEWRDAIVARFKDP